MALYTSIGDILRMRFEAGAITYKIAKRSLPFLGDLRFTPEECFRKGSDYFFTHTLASPELPTRLTPVSEAFKTRNNCYLIIIAKTITNITSEGAESNSRVEQISSCRVASAVIGPCSKTGMALILEIGDKYSLILTLSSGRAKRRRARPKEFGHIPKWVLDAIQDLPHSSTYFKRCLNTFKSKYAKQTTRKIAYEDECDLLIEFAKRLNGGDRRLHLPISDLQVLKRWEERDANPKARDHFFHTFNNLFLGFMILGHLIGNRAGSVPEHYLKRKGVTPELHHWESLWLLTCLFHDPGYVAEHFWATYSFSMGFAGPLGKAPALPEAIVESTKNAWETHFKEARTDLAALFSNVSRVWRPGTSNLASVFDLALRKAYFDGVRCGHSVMSGLFLIAACRNFRAVMHSEHDPELSLAAATIGALGMLFHDPRCRDILSANGVEPIPYEWLPYASVLMFSDAIQDDRRDITTCEFECHGILTGVHIDESSGNVQAVVDLRALPQTWWPYKIEEYEGVMAWINDVSDKKFVIEYESNIGLSQV